MNWLINLLNRKVLKNASKIDLSIGPVYLKRLTNGIVNECRRKSCIAGDILNDPLFFELMDYKLSCLSKRQINDLTVSDGKKLRNTIRSILIKEGVIKVEPVSSEGDKDILSRMKAEAKVEFDKLYAETGFRAPGVDSDG